MVGSYYTEEEIKKFHKDGREYERTIMTKTFISEYMIKEISDSIIRAFVAGWHAGSNHRSDEEKISFAKEEIRRLFER